MPFMYAAIMSIRVAAHQSQQLAALLDKDLINIIRFNNAYFRHGIIQRLPKVGDTQLVSYPELVYVQEICRAVPAPVSGDDTVGVAPADGQAGLPQHSGSKRHVS